jgi:hypothetical protein
MNKPAITNLSAILFSQNKTSTSHQPPTKRIGCGIQFPSLPEKSWSGLNPTDLFFLADADFI